MKRYLENNDNNTVLRIDQIFNHLVLTLLEFHESIIPHYRLDWKFSWSSSDMIGYYSPPELRVKNLGGRNLISIIVQLSK